MPVDQTLTDWHVASSAPGSVADPSDLDPDLEWTPAPCPGTVAGAWRAAGLWHDDASVEIDFDAFDWWLRTSFETEAGGSHVIRFGGIATIADVWLDGEHVLHSENMFVAHTVVVPAAGTHDLVVVCRSLETWLARRRPRGRWKTRLVAQQQLRWARTTLLGRMPTWPPHAAPVGLWRPVDVVGDRSLTDARLTVRVDGTNGVVALAARCGSLDVAAARLVVAGTVAPLVVERVPGGGCDISGSLVVADPALWWPGTHGEPTLHPASVELDLADGTTVTVPVGPVGFRTIVADRADGGFRLVVNGVPIFCRGACWVPVDPVALSTTRAELERALRQMADAGMNMVRVTGTMVYEQREFYELCDEIGILVWQDLMFANMDHPIDDETFASSVGIEVDQFLDGVQRHACLAVVCGGSEVEQQAAMMGIDQAELTHRLGREVLAAAVARLLPDTVYVVNSPSGGVFPFAISTGVSHYYGVGAYRRPLDDARRADVQFTSECLAFSNVPTRESLEPFLDSGDRPGHSPRWKRAVPRDRSAGWDFEDVRDHYVRELFGVDPGDVRYADPERYLDLGRAAVGVVIESTLGEWRRAGSPCAGALLFTMRDLVLGAGWGIVDSNGRPKSAYYAAARASAPIAVMITDEGLNGLAAHLVNDRSAPFAGTLTARLFDLGGAETATASSTVAIGSHGATSFSVDAMFGGFRDLSHAYRFGPLTTDVVSLVLRDTDGSVRAESCLLPGGHARPALADLGLHAEARLTAGNAVEVRLGTTRFAHHVSLDATGLDADDNWFHLVPGAERVVRMVAAAGSTGRAPSVVEVRALNSPTVLTVSVS